jgi:hypothetical protein
VEIYGDIKGLVELTPEIEQVFERLLAEEGDASFNVSEFEGKEKDVRAVVREIEAGKGGATINGIGIKEVKKMLKTLEARRPREPRTARQFIKAKGGIKITGKTARGETIDLTGGEVTKWDDAELINNKSGKAPAEMARLLAEAGYMTKADPATSAGTREDRASAARTIDEDSLFEIELESYALGDPETSARLERIENYDRNIEFAEKALGNRVERAQSIMKDIAGLEAAGYRVVGNADIEYVEGEVEKLGELTEREEKLQAEIEKLKKEGSEWKEAAERRLADKAEAVSEAVSETQEKADAEYSGALDIRIPLDSAAVAELSGTEIAEKDTPIETLRKKALDFFKKTFAGKTAKAPKIGEVNLYNTDAKKIIYDKSNRTKIEILPAVADIIEKGTMVGKPREITGRKDGIIKFYYIQAKVLLDGKPKFAQIDVGERADGKKLYYLSDITKTKSADGRVHINGSADNNIIAQKMGEINTQANRIKKNLIEEIEKRELENKEELLKELKEAKSAKEIFAAADNLIERLRQEYEKTPAGQAERRKLDAPATNWEVRKLELLKELNGFMQDLDQNTREAQALISRRNNARTGHGPSLSPEEKTRVAKAEDFLKENYTPRIMSILGRSLNNEEHLGPKDKNKIISHFASTITNFEKILDYNVDGFIRAAQQTQKRNYNRYIWRKLDALIGRKAFEKSGTVKKAKYAETAFEFLKKAKELWDLKPEMAAATMRARAEKAFAAMEKGEGSAVEDILLNEVLQFKVNGAENEPDSSRKLFDEVSALLKSGRASKVNENARKQLGREYLREAANQAIRRRKFAKGTKWLLTLADTNFKEFIKTALGTIEHDIPDAAGTIGTRKLDFSKEFDTLQGQLKTARYKYEKANALNEMFARILGLRGNNAVLNKIGELKKKIHKAENYMRVKNEMDGKEPAALLLKGKWLKETQPDIDELSKLDIMSIYLWNKQHYFVETKGWSEDLGLAARLDRQYGQAQLAEMFALLSKEEIELAETLGKFVRAQYAAENRVFRELHGFDLPQNEDYFPSVARRMDIGGDVDFMAEYAANTKNPAFVKERTISKRVAMKPTSALEIALSHTNRAAEYINEAQAFAEMKAVLKSDKIERAFEAAFGREDGADVYQKMLRVIDLQGPAKGKAKSKLDKATDFLFNGWIKSAMALKLTIGVKQFATSVSFAEKMPFEKWGQYFLEGLADARKTMDYMITVSPYIQTRFQTGGINEALARAWALLRL